VGEAVHGEGRKTLSSAADKCTPTTCEDDSMSERAGESMTQSQYDALAAELAELEGPRREAVVEAIATARGFGDLSENFAYHDAKNEQGLLERRITIMRGRLESATVVEQSTDGVVGVGSVVEIADEAGETMEIEISSVGGVSPESPLGSALVGAKVGHTVEVLAPQGSWRARVVSTR
jgi:transcription elongation factor GreA